LGIGVTLPLWDNRQGDIFAARYALMQARQIRLAQETELLGQLAAAHGEYEIALDQLSSMRDRILPAAIRSYEQITESYRGGHSAFVDLLDAQRTLTQTRAMLVDLGGEVSAARARLIGIVGRFVYPETAVGDESPILNVIPISQMPRHGAEE
jgi:cobalt-zinc-cadmium efflux system outer membrane protein